MDYANCSKCLDTGGLCFTITLPCTCKSGIIQKAVNIFKLDNERAIKSLEAQGYTVKKKPKTTEEEDEYGRCPKRNVT